MPQPSKLRYLQILEGDVLHRGALANVSGNTSSQVFIQTLFVNKTDLIMYSAMLTVLTKPPECVFNFKYVLIVQAYFCDDVLKIITFIHIYQ